MAVVHTILTKHGKTETVTLTPRGAIRKKCFDCSGWQWAEVRKCPVCTCPLWPFRGNGKPNDTIDPDPKK